MPRVSDAALADLRARNPVADVAGRLGVTLRRTGRVWLGACPMCGGGRTAQRFEIKSADAWVCAVCQDGGDVIRLVERAMGLDFRAAVAWLGGAPEVDPAVAERLARERREAQARREVEAERYREDERKRLYTLWRGSPPICGSAAALYLAHRGVEIDLRAVRFRPHVAYFHGTFENDRGVRQARTVHRGPVMLAPILRPDGVFGGLHITWLTEAGRKATIADPETGEILPSRKVRGSKRGGRIVLVDVPEARRLVMGEGIETVGIVARAEQDPWSAYWSAIDLGNLGGPAAETLPHPTERLGNGHARRIPGPVPDLAGPAIPIPATVTELVLLGDGDSEPVLTRWAMERAAARYARPDLTIRIAMAPTGQDFNDVGVAA